MRNRPTHSDAPPKSAYARAIGAVAMLLVAAVPLLCTVCVDAQAGANAAITRGIQLLGAGKFAASKAEFTAALKTNPSSADALTWRGIAENELKQYQEASTDFQAALRINPAAQPAHYNLALSLIRLGHAEAAIRELEIVVAANPEAVEAQLNLAILLERKGLLAQAAAHLSAAYRLRPTDLEVAQHLLIDELALKQGAQAGELIERLRSAGTAPEAQARIGEELVEQGFFSEAASLLEPARLALPASADLDRLLARAYIGSGQDFQAIQILKTSDSADRSGSSVYLEGLAYMAAGASGEALNAFRTAVAANPRAANARFQLGTLEFSSGGPEKADGLQQLREAVRLEPANVSYTITLGKALLENDAAAEALQYLEQVHAQGPEEALRNLLLGIAQASTTGAATALPALERAIALDPGIPLAHNLLGFCYFQVGDYAQASTSYETASRLSPQTARFAYDAALALDRENNTNEAVAYAEKAVKLDPSSGTNHYLLGKLYGKLERKQEAISELESAIRLNPDLDYSYYLLARMYLRMGDTAKAQEWNARFQQRKKDELKLHGVASMSSAPADKVTPSGLLNGSQMDPENSGPLAER